MSLRKRPKEQTGLLSLGEVRIADLYVQQLTFRPGSQTTKKAPAKKKPAASSKQAQLNFAPATGRSSTRAAATKARGKMVVS